MWCVFTLRRFFEVMNANVTARWYVRGNDTETGSNFARSLGAIAAAFSSLGSACIAGVFDGLAQIVGALYRTLKKAEVKAKVWVLKWALFFLVFIVGLFAKWLEILGNYTTTYIGCFGESYFKAGRSALSLMTSNASAHFAELITSSTLFAVFEFGFAWSSYFAGKFVFSYMTDKGDVSSWKYYLHPAGFVTFYLALVTMWNIRTATRAIVVCASEEVRSVNKKHWCAPKHLATHMASM